VSPRPEKSTKSAISWTFEDAPAKELKDSLVLTVAVGESRATTAQFRKRRTVGPCRDLRVETVTFIAPWSHLASAVFQQPAGLDAGFLVRHRVVFVALESVVGKGTRPERTRVDARSP
jgi:hypothetical protein